ncbi:hypothetical protein NWF34_06040 [Gordonia sp. GONU]|uniref:hypothetical protein n=1 Tax=Gordonia sp. GONU TaxID=2972949 RepID=UPI0021ABB3A7|nr:hypothetical protein [Gordonia sp. GONU]MCR8896517.1 hypothetical protein [Gordonia sp. GONU]
MKLDDLPSVDDIENMTPNQYKTYENMLRRAAARQGLRLAKSRTRDPRAVDYGTYMLVNATTNELEAWGLQSGYGLSLHEAHQQLLS